MQLFLKWRFSLVPLICIALWGCGTIKPSTATLRDAIDRNGFELEIVALHKNIPNIHTFGLDTHPEKSILIFESIEPEVDGSSIRIITPRNGGGFLRPIGKVRFTDSKVTIELKTGFKDSSTGEVKYTDFDLNGTYLLSR